MQAPLRGLLIAAFLLTLAGACATPPADPPAADPECRKQPPPEPVACTMEWDPVCGCDGRTYGNACEARAAGISAFDPGACDEEAARR